MEARLGHEFADLALLRLALSHASIGAHSNERLEFLGDRVLGLIVSERLYAEYPDIDEGGLAVRLNALVRREACAKAGEAAARRDASQSGPPSARAIAGVKPGTTRRRLPC